MTAVTVVKKKAGITKRTSKKALQEKLTATIADIDKELAQLRGGTSNIFKCTAQFKLNENDQNNINIQGCSDVGYMLKGIALLTNLQKTYTETAKAMKLEKCPPMLWLNYPTKDWIHDLQLRIRIVSNQERINQLTTTRAKLVPFLSIDAQLVNTLQEIDKTLNG